MALFEPRPPRERERDRRLRRRGPVPCRSLWSRTIFVARVYENIAWFYDLTFRPPRCTPAASTRLSGWESSLGTASSRSVLAPGSTAPCIHRICTVTGIDFFELDAGEGARPHWRARGVRNVRLLEMDAQNMKFADDSFRHRLRAVRDQRRAGSGRRDARDVPRLPPLAEKIIILNHFRSKSRLGSWLEKDHRAVHPSISASSPISICRRSWSRRTCTRCRLRR